MTTDVPAETRPDQARTIEEKIALLRELFADAPGGGQERRWRTSSAGWRRTRPRSRRRRSRAQAGSGAGSGKVSELTIIVPFAPGGAERLRAFLRLFGGNLAGADDVGTVHDMRFVFLDNDTRMLFATAYDGDWDAYIDDFATKIPDFLDIIDSAWEGWPGIRSPQAKDYLAKYQVTAEGWYVANDLTVAETRRLRRHRRGGGRVPGQDRRPSDTGAPGRSQLTGHRTAIRENAMTIDRLGATCAPVTVELDDIQATVLRYRPEPYYGTHVMLHVDDARAGREFLRGLTPHVDSAADWWQAGESWISVAHQLLRAGGAGRAAGLLAELPGSVPGGDGARADALRDYGDNDPKHWEPVRQRSHPHRRQRLQRLRGDVAPAPWTMARRQYEGRPGLTVLIGPGLRRPARRPEPAGLQDSIGQPAIEGSGVEPLPGQGPAIKAGEFILGYPGEAGVPLPAASAARSSDETARSSGCASTSRESGRSTASCARTPKPTTNGSCSRRNSSGAGAAVRR